MERADGKGLVAIAATIVQKRLMIDAFVDIVDLTNPRVSPGLYVQCLRLRREIFISEMGWNLYQHMGCEFDEYDTPASVHVVAQKGDVVIGCMRLLRTDNRQGGTTYMILDAHRGKIPNLPSDIMQTEICQASAWEASRMAIAKTIPANERNAVLSALLEKAIEYVSARGATTLLGLMSPLFVRVFNRSGFKAYRFGPVVDQRDGRICVIRLDFEARTNVTTGDFAVRHRA